MFLVEVAEGRRNHYSSARALGAAIRCGELGPQARIFHAATSQWLPITVHPEYRRAESEWEEDVARRWRARGWTFFSDKAAGEDGAAAMAVSTVETTPAPPSDRMPAKAQGFRLGPAMRRLLHRDRQQA
jgi:hypothetical protein